MISKAQLAGMILRHPLFQDKRFEKVVFEQGDVSNYIEMAVDRVVLAYEWDFAMAVADTSIVANQSDYTLANNCRQVFNVRYGSGTADDGYDLLRKLTSASVDRYLSERDVIGVGAWVVRPRAGGGNVVIRIIDTPTDSTKTLRYRFWKKGLTYDSLPADCGFEALVQAGVIESLLPGVGNIFNDVLRDTINSYQPSGGEDDPMVLDPYTRQRNNQRNRLFGFTTNYGERYE